MMDLRNPGDLAAALLRGPITPARIAKLWRLVRDRPPSFLEAVLAALPATVRAQVEAAK